MWNEKIKQAKREQRRVRWLRNKRAERQRKREASKQQPVTNAPRQPPDAEFLKKVWAERDKRLRNFPMQIPHLPDRKFFKNSSNFASQALACDIWAAEVILAATDPEAEITDGMIARFLISAGRTHNVKPSSLRTKIWRTRPIVRFLEDAPIWNKPGKYWPKFPESVPELGSGLQQHVDQVMAILSAMGIFDGKGKLD